MTIWVTMIVLIALIAAAIGYYDIEITSNLKACH